MQVDDRYTLLVTLINDTYLPAVGQFYDLFGDIHGVFITGLIPSKVAPVLVDAVYRFLRRVSVAACAWC